MKYVILIVRETFDTNIIQMPRDTGSIFGHTVRHTFHKILYIFICNTDCDIQLLDYGNIVLIWTQIAINGILQFLVRKDIS